MWLTRSQANLLDYRASLRSLDEIAVDRRVRRTPRLTGHQARRVIGRRRCLRRVPRLPRLRSLWAYCWVTRCPQRLSHVASSGWLFPWILEQPELIVVWIYRTHAVAVSLVTASVIPDFNRSERITSPNLTFAFCTVYCDVIRSPLFRRLIF